MTRTAVGILALLLLGAAGDALDSLRARARLSSSRAEHARQAAEDLVRLRDRAENELRVMKQEFDTGRGGFWAERRIRSQSARVRQIVEETITASESSRAAATDERAMAEELRRALFTAASTSTAAGDLEARGGRNAEASARYLEAAKLLAEAFALAVPEESDVWTGLDGEIPLQGTETHAELVAVAAAYRRSADLVHARVESLAPGLEAARGAAAAFTRLARFQGVLERGGSTRSDPGPLRDRLAESVRRGRALEAMLRARAERIEASP